MAEQYQRLSCNMNPETAAVLHEGRVMRDVSYTEQIRRAVAVHEYVRVELAAGSKIKVVRPDGEEHELYLFDV